MNSDILIIKEFNSFCDIKKKIDNYVNKYDKKPKLIRLNLEKYITSFYECEKSPHYGRTSFLGIEILDLKKIEIRDILKLEIETIYAFDVMGKIHQEVRERYNQPSAPKMIFEDFLIKIFEKWT